MKLQYLLSLLFLLAMASGCAGIRLDRGFRSSPYDWMMYGGAPTRVNKSYSVVRPPLEQVWEYNALAGVVSTPLVRDSIVLVATLHGELQAVSLSTGKRLGYIVLESAIAATPAWDGVFAYVPSSLGTETLACVRIQEGGKAWTTQLGPIESSPLLSGDSLFITTLEGMLYCVGKTDGMVWWKFETEEKEKRKPIRSSPATDGASIIFGSDDGFVYAVQRSEGTLRWKYRTGGSVFATPIVKAGQVIVGSLDGSVYALDAISGNLKWKYNTGSKVFGAAAASDNLIFIGSADGRLHALRSDSGTEAWTFATRSVINSAPLVSGDLVYVGSLDRTLYALNADHGQQVWQFSVEGRVKVSPVIWGNTLLLTSEDKYVTAFRPVQPQ